MFLAHFYSSYKTRSFKLQKRATIRTQDYFYHPLVNTPFSLGIVLPRDYGRFRVNGKIEVSLTEYNSKSAVIVGIVDDRDV